MATSTGSISGAKPRSEVERSSRIDLRPHGIPSARGDRRRHGPAVLQATFDLVAPAGTIGQETRPTSSAGRAIVGSIDCEFAIQASHGPVMIGDTKEGTFAIRVVKALDSPPGRMVNANGARERKASGANVAEWVDYYGRVAQRRGRHRRVRSPEQSARSDYWHARAYGLLAANPFGIRLFHGRPPAQWKGTQFARVRSLVFRYRVVIHDGDPAQAGIAEAYRSSRLGSR